MPSPEVVLYRIVTGIVLLIIAAALGLPHGVLVAIIVGFFAASLLYDCRRDS